MCNVNSEILNQLQQNEQNEPINDGIVRHRDKNSEKVHDRASPHAKKIIKFYFMKLKKIIFNCQLS